MACPASIAAKDLTVNELILAYWKHAEQHYRPSRWHIDQGVSGHPAVMPAPKRDVRPYPGQGVRPAGPQGCSPSDGDRQLDERQAEDPANRPW